MRKLSTLVFFLFFLQNAIAQAPPWAWAVTGGNSPGNETVTAMATDAAGNSYAGGVFNGAFAVFGNDTFTNPYIQQSFIAKYDVNGNLQWAQGLLGSGDPIIYSMTTDNAGNLVIAGALDNGYMLFGSDTLFYTQEDLFVAKYAPNGTILWYNSCHGSTQFTDTWCGAVTTNAAGDVFFAGSYEGDNLVADSYSLPFTSLGPDIFVLRYNSAGAIMQAVYVHDQGLEQVNAIAVAPNGNIIIGGKFMGQYTFGSNTVTAPATANDDLFVAAFSPTLAQLWISSCVGSGTDEVIDLQVDVSGNIYTVGTMYGNQLIAGNDTLSVTPASINVLAVKFNATGVVQWARVYGTNSNNDDARGIALDMNGYPTIMGQLPNTTTFGNYTCPAGAFVARLDPFGNVAWVTSVDVQGWACSSDGVDHFYLAGDFSAPDTILFSPVVAIPQGQNDVFVAQMDFQTGIAAHVAGETTLTFPNPTMGRVSLGGLDPATAYSVMVYNLLGETVHTEFLKCGTNTLDLSGLPKGLYVLEAQGEIKHTYKVVLE